METAKAVWDADTARIFYEICAKQVKDGNRPTKFLSATGYKNLIEEFHKQTGRNYTRKQMKNRWDDLKTIWTAWVYFNNKATGLGWDPVKQTVTASDEQWADMIKVHKAVRGFRKGPLDNMLLLKDIFENANVSGKSSVMPGVEEEETAAAVDIDGNYVDLDDEDEETPEPSPTPVTKKGRAAAIACSPKRLKKDPYGKDFKRFVDHVKKDPYGKDLKRFVDHVISEDHLKSSINVSVANDIDAIMQEVVKCGAPETSDEYYIAKKLFGKLQNWCFFYAMKTSEGKLQWLKRQYEDRKKH